MQILLLCSWLLRGLRVAVSCVCVQMQMAPACDLQLTTACDNVAKGFQR